MEEMKNDLKMSGPSTETPLSILLDLQNENGKVINPRCKICNSPFRTEVEKIFEDKGGLSKIKTFLDSKGEVLSVSIIRNHLNEHYRSQERLAYMLEYRDNVEALMARRKDRMRDIEYTINVSMIELNRILSIETSGDLSREAEKSDMFIKTTKCIREGIDMINKMEIEDDRTKVFQDKIINVMMFQIRNAKSDDEKNVLISAMEGFKEVLQFGGGLKNAKPA